MISKRARFLNWLLRKYDLKGKSTNPEFSEKMLARNRKSGPARPGWWLRWRCEIVQHNVQGSILYEVSRRKNGSQLHIFYLHGGGYILDIFSAHWGLLKKLVKKTGASLSVPIYPLAPENKWDQSYPMVMEAYERAVAKYGAENIVVMGDSAGGGYTLGLSQMLRDQGKPQPAKLVLLSPYIDLTASDPSQVELEKTDVMISIEGIRRGGPWWAKEGEDPASFPVSPLFHPVDNLPPMQLFAGTAETLFADAERLKKKGDEAGASISYHPYEQMQHVWMLGPIPEGKRAINEIVDYISAPSRVSAPTAQPSISKQPEVA